MKPGTGRILFLCLAILAGAWLLAEYMSGALVGEESVQVGPAQSLIDLSLGPAAEVTAMSWTREGGTVSLARDADTGLWEDADDMSCPIDSAAAEELAQALSRVTAEMAISDVTDFAQYGLDEPALSVAAAAGERIARYELGNASLGGGYYLRVDGTDTVYLETGSLAPAFSVTQEQLLRLEQVPPDIAEVTGLSVTTEAGAYELVRSASDGLWRRADTGEETALDTGRVLRLYEPLTELSLTRCVSWRAGDAAACGFDEPQGTVTVRYENDAGRNRAFSLEFGAYEGEEVYVRFAGSDMIYLTEAGALDGLMYPDWEAMRPQAALPVELGSVSAVRARLDGTWHEILRLEETTQTAVSDGGSVDVTEVIYSCSGWVLPRSRFEPWLEKLLALAGDGGTGTGEGRKLLMSVELNYAGPEGEELTQSAAFYSYDSAHDLCVCGEGRRLLVPRGAAEELAGQLRQILSEEGT